MYYSSKLIVDFDTIPVVTHMFQGRGKDLPLEATPEDIENQRKLEEQITFLGQVDGINYHFVPDSLELVEQPKKAEVTKLATLPPEVETKLQLDGDYVKACRLFAAAEQLNRANGTYYQLIQVRQDITDLADVLAQMLEATPTTLAQNISPALATLKRLKKSADATSALISKVGL